MSADVVNYSFQRSPTFFATTRFVPAPVYNVGATASIENVATAFPRVFMPAKDVTVRTRR